MQRLLEELSDGVSLVEMYSAGRVGGSSVVEMCGAARFVES